MMSGKQGFARKILYCLFILLFTIDEPSYVAAQSATGDVFTDIRYSYANYEINQLAREKIIKGYRDGTFRPDRLINREEFGTVVGRTLGLFTTKNNQAVPVRVSSWAEPWVSAVMDAKIPNVLPNKHWFGAKNRITREEAIMWYVRVLGVEDKLDRIKDKPDFNDVDLISDDAQHSIWLAQKLGLIHGDRDRNFKPQAFLDRQGAAVITHRVYQNIENYRVNALNLLESLKQPPNPVTSQPPDPPDLVTPQPPDPPDPVTPQPSDPPDPVTPQPPDPPDPVTPDPVLVPVSVTVATYTIPSAQEALGSNWRVEYSLHDGDNQKIPENRLPADLEISFSDDFSILSTDGDIANVNNIPLSGSEIQGLVRITSVQKGIDFSQTFQLIVDPSGPVTPDTVLVPVSVTVATYTIPSAQEALGSNWKMEYSLLDASGQHIPEHLLPGDLEIVFSDDFNILGKDGNIDNFYNIPLSGSEIQGLVRITSVQNGTDFSQTFQLIVDPAGTGQQYMGISILLEDTGAQATTIAEMDEIRNMFSSIDPSLKVTWAMDNRFVFGESQRPQLQRLLQYVDTYGDEVGIVSGYPNNNYSLSQWAAEMNSWMYMYRYNAFTDLHVGNTNGEPSVWSSIPEAYRPKSLSTLAVNPEQALWLKQNFQIDSFMGWAATQYNVDQLSAEGSPLMPYWSNINNPMVPAQSMAENSGLIFMNAITIDPIGSRYTTGSSRWTIHPADPYVVELSALPQLRTTSNYMSNPYREQNTLNYLSLVIGANWVMRTPNLKENLSMYMNQFPRQTVTQVVGVHQLSEIFKQRSGGTNDQIQFTLMFRGTGYTTSLGGNESPANLRYLWMETKTERIILSKEDQETHWNIIDFTDYSRTPVPVLPYTQNGAADDISYVTGRNYKLTPHAPLTSSEMDRVNMRLQSLHFNEPVNNP
ncbi:S-layer homology domain-containing protein [Paenibacillus sp. 2TAF8]|uniref:S-layer homology domain-containing protein n=1 Tax=Paenibacillus sp. 2TAF8 TaxID=3233020 RepID=UPI003F980827